ncbi:Zn-ribbon domain-containing OB-fold protein [Gemmatimonas sp.]|uniref:Zn-ribbon domain-containing OB-fold protein n=1 Tax=Gemmatimonas sp. TaxID=1962908 RepID=UPI0035639444
MNTLTPIELPVPKPDADSELFWAALRDEHLLVQRCGACGTAQLYFRAMCSACWSRDLAHEQSPGHGMVYSFSVVHQIGQPALRAEVPYALALVDLDEGPRVLSRVVGDPDAVQIGQRVTATFRHFSEHTLLYFVQDSVDATTDNDK